MLIKISSRRNMQFLFACKTALSHWRWDLFLLSVSEIGRRHCAVRDPAAVIRSNGLREQKTLSLITKVKIFFHSWSTFIVFYKCKWLRHGPYWLSLRMFSSCSFLDLMNLYRVGYSQKGIEMCSFIVVEKLKAESLRNSKTDILRLVFHPNNITN